MAAKPMATVHEVVAYLEMAIGQFDKDPADTDHQEGYFEALKEARRVVLGEYAQASEEPGKSASFDAAVKGA